MEEEIVPNAIPRMTVINQIEKRKEKQKKVKFHSNHKNTVPFIGSGSKRKRTVDKQGTVENA